MSRHDVEAKRGNYDHILVGPSGAYLLETKSPNGSVETTSDGFKVSRPGGADYEHLSTLGRRMRRQAARLHSEIARAVRVAPWIEPVVVVWAPFQEGTAPRKGVTYVHGKQLQAWLRARKGSLAADRHRAMIEFLSQIDSSE